MEYIHDFLIAEHIVRLVFAPNGKNDMRLLPSFKAFKTASVPDDELFFTLEVDDNLCPNKERQLIRSFDTGNGDTVVYQLANQGYQYIIRNIAGNDCCLLETNATFTHCRCALCGNWTMRTFGLNNALMLIFAFAGSFHDTLLIHASCVSCAGYGYPFIAKSGTGKSTHSSLWLKYIEATELMNDDNPIIRVINGKPFIYGSPWSGKTPCYRQTKAPLGAITRIDRALENTIERHSPVQAFASILPACSSMKWDAVIYNNLMDTLTKIIATIPIYTLHCLPDEEAAVLCHHTICPPQQASVS